MSVEVPLFTSLFFFSLHDIRKGTAPGIFFFFVSCFLVGLVEDPLRAVIVLLALLWAQLRLSTLWLWLLLFHPAAWMVCWLGFSMRQGIAGEADVYAIAGLACVLPWQAQVAAMLGLELWRRWWSYRKLPGYMPALPGLLLGAFGYWLVRVVLLEA